MRKPSLPRSSLNRCLRKRKKANNDRKGKAEDRVEVLAGSFMKIISVALNKDTEMELDIE